jgi:hypothetical protein
MNAKTEVTVLDTQALAQVEGGTYVSDDYCFRPRFPWPWPQGPDPRVILDLGQLVQVR